MVADGKAEIAGIGFTGPDGAAVSLADFEGRVVLINLWGIFCPPCVKEMPTLATLQREMGSERFVVLAVSVDPVPDTEASRIRLAELSDGVLSFYHDPGYGLVYGFGARGFPTTFLIGADGREIARLEGEADWASEEARGLIKWALEHRTKPD
jgi:thiol-disulfide isomerase/thioredoxin